MRGRSTSIAIGGMNINAFLMRAVAVLLILVLASSCVVSGRYARYTASASGSDSMRVARFVAEVGDLATIDLSDIEKPGDSKVFAFEVANSNATDVSEVASNYEIGLRLQGNLPLTCTVSENNVPVFSLDSMDAIDGSGVGKTEGGSFPAASGESHEYLLTVSWPNDRNGSAYAESNMLATLTVLVSIDQID